MRRIYGYSRRGHDVWITASRWRRALACRLADATRNDRMLPYWRTRRVLRGLRRLLLSPQQWPCRLGGPDPMPALTAQQRAKLTADEVRQYNRSRAQRNRCPR